MFIIGQLLAQVISGVNVGQFCKGYIWRLYCLGLSENRSRENLGIACPPTGCDVYRWRQSVNGTSRIIYDLRKRSGSERSQPTV